uniref:Uncharacterized protein n=1 Tax=Anguilla anguilla TaxID=7936 RepID=A0A0E9PEL9_ANGAN
MYFWIPRNCYPCLNMLCSLI